VSIAFQLFRISYYGCFPYFFEKRKIWKIEKFNALKAARPEVAADTEDTMEFAVEEETAS
jgi:hypothetical protein